MSATGTTPIPPTSSEAGPSSPRRLPSPVVPLSSLPPQGTPIHNKPSGWTFYRDVLGSPKYIVAPMVAASELPWRLLSRDLGADLCYSPMINSSAMLDCVKGSGKGAKERLKTWFDAETGEEGHGRDKMLVAQFAGNDPQTLLQAAEYVQDHCLAVDLNLGCPQHIAKRGFYGSFLQEDWPLIFRLINILHINLKVPVTAKMRVFPDVETTVSYAKMLQHAGAQIVTVHGRTREQKGHKTGVADWAKIRAVKEALDVPVFANGNILYGEDLAAALEQTGADGVMSAEGNLYTPSIFSSPEIRAKYGKDVFPYLDDVEHPEWSSLPSCTAMATMYLDELVQCKTKTTPVAVKSHLIKICKPALDKHRDSMIAFGKANFKKGQDPQKDADEEVWRSVREESVHEYRSAIRELEAKLVEDRKDPTFLAPAAGQDQTKLPPEFRFAPHWLCQPYYRPPMPDQTESKGESKKQEQGKKTRSSADGSDNPGGMVDTADEQARGEKRVLQEDGHNGQPSLEETTEQKKLRLQDQLQQAQDLKAQANVHFAKKEFEEACSAWTDAVGVLPPVEAVDVKTSASDASESETPGASPELQIREVTEDEAAAFQDPDVQAVQQLQRQHDDLRTTLWSNIAEARLRLEQWDLAKQACDHALACTPTHLKSLPRRASANEHLGTHDALASAIKDLQAVLSHPDLPSSQQPAMQATLARVQRKQQEAMEREKEEMLGKLKGLGNSILGKFGLSTDNFKFEQNEGGSWGMKFQR